MRAIDVGTIRCAPYQEEGLRLEFYAPDLMNPHPDYPAFARRMTWKTARKLHQALGALLEKRSHRG